MIQFVAWTNTFWAGKNINNLTESIVDIAVRGDLQTMRNVGSEIEQYILDTLKRMA